MIIKGVFDIIQSLSNNVNCRNYSVYQNVAIQNDLFYQVFDVSSGSDLKIKSDFTKDALKNYTKSQLYEFVCVMLPFALSHLHPNFCVVIDQLIEQDLSEVNYDKTGRIVMFALIELLGKSSLKTVMFSNTNITSLYNNEIFKTAYTIKYSENCKYQQFAMNSNIVEKLRQASLKELCDFLLVANPFFATWPSIYVKITHVLLQNGMNICSDRKGPNKEEKVNVQPTLRDSIDETQKQIKIIDAQILAAQNKKNELCMSLFSSYKQLDMYENLHMSLSDSYGQLLDKHKEQSEKLLTIKEIVNKQIL